MNYSEQAESIFSGSDLERLLDLSHFINLDNLDNETYTPYLEELAKILNASELPTENQGFFEDQLTSIHAETVKECSNQQCIRPEKNCSSQQPDQLKCVEQKKIQNVIKQVPSPSTTFQEEYTAKEKKIDCSISFNQDQLAFLELEFQKYPCPDDYVHSKLALVLNTSNDKVKKWFEDRHIKQKKLESHRESQKDQEQRTQVSLKPMKKCTKDQKDMLEDEFTKCKYPDHCTYKKIAFKLNLPEKRIRYWFQRRRAKQRPNQKSKFRAAPLILNKIQLKELNDAFQKCEYPKAQQILELASKLNLSGKRVRIWFSKRRYAIKKLNDSHGFETATEIKS